jgi:cystathionine beta-lyase/cystathionine gamma-synthase
VLHSTTKYIGGHCDVLGGALITDDPKIFEELKFIQNACGAVPSPQDCFLLLRGIKTLSLRVQRHAENAQRVAEFLEIIRSGAGDLSRIEVASSNSSWPSGKPRALARL